MNDYKNTDARGGTPEHQKTHDKDMAMVDRETKHLTSPSGGAKKIGNAPTPREKTHEMRDDMGPVKKVAGGSNY